MCWKVFTSNVIKGFGCQKNIIICFTELSLVFGSAVYEKKNYILLNFLGHRKRFLQNSDLTDDDHRHDNEMVFGIISVSGIALSEYLYTIYGTPNRKILSVKGRKDYL